MSTRDLEYTTTFDGNNQVSIKMDLDTFQVLRSSPTTFVARISRIGSSTRPATTMRACAKTLHARCRPAPMTVR